MKGKFGQWEGSESQRLWVEGGYSPDYESFAKYSGNDYDGSEQEMEKLLEDNE